MATDIYIYIYVYIYMYIYINVYMYVYIDGHNILRLLHEITNCVSNILPPYYTV